MAPIGIVNYGLGNLRSVQKAFEHEGADAVVLNHPDGLNGIGKLVLPGVGAFADGMRLLHAGGWIEPILAAVERGLPLLGVCLGMQLLFESSTEDAASPDRPIAGLGVLPGCVVRFREGLTGSDGERLKVPHMGWNTLEWERDDPLLDGLDRDAAVYFVHSYFVKPSESPDAPLTTATADYGGPFSATVWRDRVWATQFHPEKSQRVGLRMLRNFAQLE